ncbi:MAG TPA: VC0807 family protein [Acidimicrobiales bacterium]|nr:VC0807 family protein [Acidimicrobiales bacterium]
MSVQPAEVLMVRGQAVAVADLPPPPNLRSVAQQLGWRGATDGLVPLALFLVLNTAISIQAAMIGATAWTLAMMIFHRRSGRTVGGLLWFSAAFVVARGAAGVVTGSKYVYFGPGIANNVVIALVFLGSVVIRRPAVGYIARFIYPFTDAVISHPQYRRVMARLTLAWAAYELFSSGFQAWLLTTASANTLVWARAVVTWPLLVGLFAFSLRYPRRALGRDPELAPVVAAVEAKRR